MRPRALVIAVVSSLLLLGWTQPSFAAVSVSRAELSGSTLRVEGSRAVARAPILIDGIERGRADRRGRFDIQVSGFVSPTCRITVDDGTGGVETGVSGCTPTEPEPQPEPQPEPEPEPATPTAASVTLSPSSVTAGATSTATVALTAPAPTGGAGVALASSNTGVATVAPTVTVPAGHTSTTATVSTSAVSTTSSAAISATYGGVTQTSTLTVTPQASSSVTLSSLTITPDTLPAGATAQGSVTLTGPAPSAGASVSLFSTNTGIARVPATVTVPAGESTASFGVTAQNASTVSATIWASYNGTSRSATVTVTSPPPSEATLSALTISPSTVTGGQSSEGTVTFSAPVAADTVVALTSTDTTVATVASSVTVPAGASSAVFAITTHPVSGTGTFAVITGSAGGVERGASINVNPGAPASAPSVSSVTFAPGTVQGSHPATGTVTLDGPATDGAVLTLASSHPDLVEVPTEIVIAVNATSVAFPVTTRATSADTEVTITATANCCGATGSRSGVLPVLRTTSPPVADTVRITDVEWRRCIFSIEATSTNPDAILTVHLTESDSIVLRLTNEGGGIYTGERAWRAPGTDVPVSITLRSNFGGSVTTTVSDPEAGACRADL